jgi:hypothetical protein
LGLACRLRYFPIDAHLRGGFRPTYYRMLVPIGPLDVSWMRALIADVMNGLLAKPR